MPATYPSIADHTDPVGDSLLIGDDWLTFNRQLNRDAIGLPNEATFESRLEGLQALEIVDSRILWLTAARLAELVVKQAGDYADNCEFQAAGDLLVNPRRIDIYLRRCPAPILKKRHCALSEQFSAAIGNENPAVWMSRETVSHIKQEALLPHLNGMLSSSGFMNPEYLSELEGRMCRVADTIAFLSAWQANGSNALIRRAKNASPADRKMVADHLCRFNHDDFHAMGDDMEEIILRGGAGSRFICPSA